MKTSFCVCVCVCRFRHLHFNLSYIYTRPFPIWSHFQKRHISVSMKFSSEKNCFYTLHFLPMFSSRKRTFSLKQTQNQTTRKYKMKSVRNNSLHYQNEQKNPDRKQTQTNIIETKTREKERERVEAYTKRNDNFSKRRKDKHQTWRNTKNVLMLR